jgi:hypothetical protein
MRRWLSSFHLANVAVVLAATGLLASAVHAQSTMRFVGSFTLPCEANWAGAVLPAGDYTMKLASLSKDSFIRVDAVRGNASAYIPQWSTADKVGDKNVILLTVAGERCVVRALNLADLNMEIIYKPISKKEMASLESGKPGRMLALVVAKH